MRNFQTIYLKELRGYLGSPTVYIVALLYTLLTGFLGYSMLADFSAKSRLSADELWMYHSLDRLDITEYCVSQFYWSSNLILCFLAPLLTMRLLAEERRMGTFELLFSYPVRDVELVLAKYAACLTVTLGMIAASLVYFIFPFAFGHPEVGVFLSGLLGLALLAALYIAIGIFFSSLTENQIVAAVLSVAAFLLLLLLSTLESLPLGGGQLAAQALSQASTTIHLEVLFTGVVDSLNVIYFVLASWFFLYATLRVLETKQWRG